MLTNLHAAVVMIVFAGGPHTPTRAAYAEQLLPQVAPRAIFLTGAEFARAGAGAPDDIRPHVAALARQAPVSIDPSATTLQSCRYLVREIPRRFPTGTRLVVVTSDYHATRVAWLLRGLLPEGFPLEIRRAPDMPWRTALDTPLNRQLLRGEVVSWLYCLPLGLALRPAAAALLVATTILACLAVSRLRPRVPSA